MRISMDDAEKLWDEPLAELGRLADAAKRDRHGDVVTYIKTYYLNVTNVCKYACKYCGFRRNVDDSDAYTLSIDQVAAKLTHSPEQLTEVWMSSGLNPALKFEFYEDLLRTIRQVVPQATIKGFTAVEIDFFATHFALPVEEVIERLIAAGLGRIPAGGAEIFDLAIRKKIDIKTRPERYLQIHRLFHERGLPTSVTMLFGHVEQRTHRLKHLQTIRDFQDQGGGFQAIIPLAYQDQNNPLAKRGIRGPSPVEILKTLAISRIFLDNVPHVQSFWVDSGEETTQISLHFGVDDINGTLIEENIAHESGAGTATYQSSAALQDWIRGAGFVPQERDASFQYLSHDA
ncbi:MAG: CofH family radical SAM protein [Zetaproteobacteria bacterium]|nr:CofH family radical SAM protein [Zetaproteobacteria bacterium]